MIKMILSAALLLFARPQAPAMNFFITSAGPGKGADISRGRPLCKALSQRSRRR